MNEDELGPLYQSKSPVSVGESSVSHEEIEKLAQSFLGFSESERQELLNGLIASGDEEVIPLWLAIISRNEK